MIDNRLISWIRDDIKESRIQSVDPDLSDEEQCYFDGRIDVLKALLYKARELELLGLKEVL